MIIYVTFLTSFSWQFGAVLPITGRTHDDTNTIFTDDAEYNELVVQYVPRMEAKNA